MARLARRTHTASLWATCLVGAVAVRLAAYLATPWAVVGPVVFVAFITRFQIVPEERALQRRFGVSGIDEKASRPGSAAIAPATKSSTKKSSDK